MSTACQADDRQASFVFFVAVMIRALLSSFKFDKAALVLLVLCLLTLVPLLVVVSGLGRADPAIWAHLVDNQLPTLVRNTLGLVVLTAVFSLLIGTSLGWLVAMHDFAGRRWLEWALMLPLAVPVYVMAFSQLGLFDYTGPIQTLLRGWTGVNVQAFFPLRSMVGVSLVMSLAFYPYVYLLARNAFKTMGQRALEVGQSLGYSPRRAFWRVALPMARPWLFGGVMLVVMETLADFGAVSIFNFDTLTSGIYKAWFSLFSLPTAQQLAAILLLVVLLVVGFEQYWRGRRRYAAVGGASKSRRVVLTGWAAWRASVWAGWVFLLAFALPVGQLVVWALPSLSVWCWLRCV
nr:ABC transporter permease subunit [Formosimonas limnophila]